MSDARRVPPNYNQPPPTKISILLALFGLGSYKSKSPQECREIIEAANESVKQSQAILAESEIVNQAALKVLARKS